ncbi:MAG: aminoacyl-tRNA hydrolase [Bacilli bacterium]|nr:aminoacyl-tRNA hydrolase [Bacilli bacterium]
MLKLIVGLGNPGKEYEKTRHNIGYMVVNEVAKRMHLEFKKKKFNGMYLETVINGDKIIILKPEKYMNLSGEVILKYVNFFKIDSNDILIISDDLDMELGRIKLKQFGGTGGHKGLINVEQNLKTDDYKRLKIGISNNKEIPTSDYVLGKFNDEEENIITDSVNKAANIVIEFINNDFLSLMNKYNSK